jgi:hypothetical protein
MGLELTNARLTTNLGNNAAFVQKIKPPTPSIAEGAVFIEKPHKRVEFQLQLPEPSTASAQFVPGQDGGVDYTKPTGPQSNDPKVVMKINDHPEKIQNAYGVQQEGRQINHEHTVNYLEQYDAYGRPRMGDSREPYDFAYTKFMVKTSQLMFQKNMADSHDAANKIVDKFVNDPTNNPKPAGNSNVTSYASEPGSTVSVKA